MALAACVIPGSCDRPPSPPHATTTTTFTLYAKGEPSETDVPPESPLFGKLLAYVNTPATEDGGTTFATYAPSLVIECKTIRVNLHGANVVVSTRSGPEDTRTQVVRPATAADASIERAVRAYLAALDVADSAWPTSTFNHLDAHTVTWAFDDSAAAKAMEFLWSNGIPAKLRRPSITLASLAPRPSLSDHLRGNVPPEPESRPSLERWTIYKVRTQASGPVLAICELEHLSVPIDPLKTATLFASEDAAWRTLRGTVRRANEFDIQIWRALGRPDVVAALDPSASDESAPK